MQILLIRNTNPFFESNASGNRYASLIKGLLMCNIQITLLVTGGYRSTEEKLTNGIKSKESGLIIHYSLKTQNSNKWIRMANKYLFAGMWRIKNRKIIQKYFSNSYDLLWLTQDGELLALYNKYHNTIRPKSFIELNEFNDIYKFDDTVTRIQYKELSFRDEELKKALKNVDIFAVMTNTLMSHYKTLAQPSAKFMLLPMTVDLSRFEHVPVVGNDYSQPYIAFTGTMTNQKDGVDILIKAFAKIAEKYPTLHLYLAGFWHYDVPMQEQLIADFGLKKRIHYLGALDRNKIPSFLCNASVLALSRPDSHQAQGGFPTKLGEYLATGNPVCVTKVGEIPDYLEDNVSAFMAEPGDVDSFADALNRALQDSEKAKLVGAKGKEVAEKTFNAEIQSKRLSEFLKANVK